MLDKETRKKFSEKSFEKIKRQDSNWSQTRIRLREHVKTAFDDIILLAKKLPDEEQSELFRHEQIRLVLSALFEHKSFTSRLDARRAKLASTIAELGLSECGYQYSFIESVRVINRKVLDTLKEADSIASAIADKVEIQSKSH